MKVETDSIASIAVSPIERAVILVIYVETFKAEVIVFFISIVIMGLSLQRLIFSIRASLLILITSLREIKEKNVQIT